MGEKKAADADAATQTTTTVVGTEGDASSLSLPSSWLLTNSGRHTSELTHTCLYISRSRSYRSSSR